VNLENDLSIRLATAAGSLKGKPAEQRAWAEALSDAELDWVVEQGGAQVAAAAKTTESTTPGTDADAVAQLVRACEQLYQERSPDAM
jgi:hypothetical protein